MLMGMTSNSFHGTGKQNMNLEDGADSDSDSVGLRCIFD